MRSYPSLVVLVLGLACACGGGGGGGGGNEDEVPPPGGTTDETFLVLGSSDLGMSMVDADFGVFSFAPPATTVRAQVLSRVGGPDLLDPTAVTLRTMAVSDSRGSRNSSSLGGKTDFWDRMGAAFGLENGEGLQGEYMPGDRPAAGDATMTWRAERQAFVAAAMPVFPRDDSGAANPFSILRIVAHDAVTGDMLASADIVLPVSDEALCRTCHITGGMAASAGGTTWSTNSDIEVQSRENVLLVHDRDHGTSLMSMQPVRCTNCHASARLNLDEPPAGGSGGGLPALSVAMHEAHGGFFSSGATAQDSCFKCHAGSTDRMARGAMRTGGMDCVDCHGNVFDVGGRDVLAAGGSKDGNNDGGARRPWVDLPRCQSCHTGDALDSLAGDPNAVLAPDGLRLRQAYRIGDAAASPILATNKRFAENAETSYRASRGHGGLACSACHGSAHAIWPNPDPAANDNLVADELQGHAGTITECAACHESLEMTLGGPHGMHNVNDPRWTDHRHEGFFESNPDSCRACHGSDLRGSPLSRAATRRTLRADGDTVVIEKGQPVGCNHCHGIPGFEDDDD
jgi:hypothetical protein